MTYQVTVGAGGIQTSYAHATSGANSMLIGNGLNVNAVVVDTVVVQCFHCRVDQEAEEITTPVVTV